MANYRHLHRKKEKLYFYNIDTSFSHLPPLAVIPTPHTLRFIQKRLTLLWKTVDPLEKLGLLFLSGGPTVFQKRVGSIFLEGRLFGGEELIVQREEFVWKVTILPSNGFLFLTWQGGIKLKDESWKMKIWPASRFSFSLSLQRSSSASVPRQK